MQSGIASKWFFTLLKIVRRKMWLLLVYWQVCIWCLYQDSSNAANPRKASRKQRPSQHPAVHTQDSLPPSLLTSKRSPAGQPRYGRWVFYGTAYEFSYEINIEAHNSNQTQVPRFHAGVPPPDGSSKMTLNLSSGFFSSTYSLSATTEILEGLEFHK